MLQEIVEHMWTPCSWWAQESIGHWPTHWREISPKTASKDKCRTTTADGDLDGNCMFFTSTKTLDTFGHTSIWILFCKKEGSCATFEPLGPCASHSIWGTQRRRCWSMTRAPVLWNGRHSTPEKIRKSEKIWNRPQKIWGGNIETPSNLLTSLSFSFWSSLCSIEVLHELSGHLRSWYLSRSSLEKSGCLNCGVSGLIHPRYWGKSWLCWYHQHAL